MKKQPIENSLKSVEEKLDTIIRILSLEVGSDKSLTERVGLLKLAGIDNKTIAKILKTKSNIVRSLAYQAKKK